MQLEQKIQLYVNKNTEILEMIATGQPTSGIYDAIALMYESGNPGMRCSLLELKNERLMHGGAPSLPKKYCEAVNGLKYGPNVGSCGTSTYTGKRVIVENIETDPLWADLKQVALPHGMRCCWSEPIKDSKGKVMGAFGMYFNHPALPDENQLADLVSAARLASIVMERDQREQALCQSELSYRSLVENLPQRFFRKDKNSTYVACSNNFAEDLGVSSESIIGTNDFDYFSAEVAARYQQSDQRVMREGKPEEFEEILLTQGGKRVVQSVKSPIFDDEGNVDGILGFAWDITEIKELREQYQQAQKMESIGTLVGGVAHEFNNTLTGIAGYLFLAKKETEANTKLMSHLNKMSTLSFRAAEMIEQLLAFSRKSSIQIKPLNISSFFKETYKLHKLSVPENIKLDAHFSSEDMFIKGDSSQVQQMLTNLLHNAKDAVKHNSNPAINISLENFSPNAKFLSLHPGVGAKSFAHLVVEDNGCGIKEEDKNKIFEPFFTTKKVGEGTGLGLAMVYGAVKAHKGILEVESSVDKGSRIHLYLPITTVKAEEKRPSKNQQFYGDGETILLVDDQQELCELGSEILKGLGYKVLLASNGTDAVEVYKNNQSIDLVILDVVMPDMGGVDAALLIKEINNAAKIIFCTGYDGKDVLNDEVLQWSNVVTKPYKIDEFSEVIYSTISRD